MKKIVFLLLFFLTTTVFAQQVFPDSWIGNYGGDLEIFAVDSIAMKLKMKLAIQPTKSDSTYQWKLTYVFKGEEDIRDYELKIVSKEKGYYQIDEKNSIVIDAYHRHNSFTSYFEVNNSTIIASYQKEGNNILFEIIASDTKPVSTTGGKLFKEEEIPEVKSYKIGGRQRCILKRLE